MEQAEKKARVEAQERTEQLKSERLLEESRLEKEKAMAKAEAAAAELDAKFKAAREMAIKEVEKRMKEESEIRKMVSLFELGRGVSCVYREADAAALSPLFPLHAFR